MSEQKAEKAHMSWCPFDGRIHDPEHVCWREARSVCDCAPDCAERIACEEIGTLGHMGCGWCEVHDQARHICLCQVSDARTPPAEPIVTATKSSGESIDLLAALQRSIDAAKAVRTPPN